ncbi:MAG: NAD(P)/FAD-dependent oxidoreductase, partial [Shewanella sp.]
MTALAHTSSYYAASANPVTLQASLSESIQADVCIIGAGYTGLSTAIHLLESGLSVVVLEAARIGFGASGRNGGQIVNSFSRDIDSFERSLGKDKARIFGQMAFEGGRIIRRLVKDYQINCSLKDGGVFAALNTKQMHHLEQQKALWERHGHVGWLELLDKDAITKVVATDVYQGGLLDKSGGHFHPLNLALGEAQALLKLGGQNYDDSAVLDIKQGEPAVVNTASGQVTAKFVVVAGNAYLSNLLPELQAKSMPCGTQVITTEPLDSDVAKRL